jgi:hypothetical protein
MHSEIDQFEFNVCLSLPLKPIFSMNLDISSITSLMYPAASHKGLNIGSICHADVDRDKYYMSLMEKVQGKKLLYRP